MGVAAVEKSVPVEPFKKFTDDVKLMPKLQLVFMVVKYQPSLLLKLQQTIARCRKNSMEKSWVLREEDNEIEDGYMVEDTDQLPVIQISSNYTKSSSSIYWN